MKAGWLEKKSLTPTLIYLSLNMMLCMFLLPFKHSTLLFTFLKVCRAFLIYSLWKVIVILPLHHSANCKLISAQTPVLMRRAYR